MSNFKQLLQQFWADDSGAVITAEYLLLGSIVTAAAGASLGNMRDATVQESKEFSAAVRNLNQSYAIPAQHSSTGATAGSAYTNPTPPTFVPPTNVTP